MCETHRFVSALRYSRFPIKFAILHILAGMANERKECFSGQIKERRSKGTLIYFIGEERKNEGQ